MEVIINILYRRNLHDAYIWLKKIKTTGMHFNKVNPKYVILSIDYWHKTIKKSNTYQKNVNHKSHNLFDIFNSYNPKRFMSLVLVL